VSSSPVVLLPRKGEVPLCLLFSLKEAETWKHTLEAARKESLLLRPKSRARRGRSSFVAPPKNLY
jgi:hypothetical protein